MDKTYHTNLSEVDVLIIGAGPTGLMAAASCIRLGFNIRIVDQAAGPRKAERTVVIQARTCEILDQMGIAGPLISGAYAATGASLYENGQDKKTMDYHTIIDSEFPNLYIYSEIEIEELFIRDLKDHGVEINRSTRLVDFEVQEGSGDPESESEPYPIFATLMNADGESEVIFAKYIIGADGTHSFVRRKLALDFNGPCTTLREAFVDAEFESDMPELENVILSKNNGVSIIYVPRGKRNGHYFAQFSVHLPATEILMPNMIMSEEATLEMIKRALAPYKFTFKHIRRFNVYEASERVASSFDFSNRIFLGGDSCHSHPIKGGMDINLAIADMQNLCWKLFWYERVGLGDRALLDSYTVERRATSQGAIELTARVAQLSAGIANSRGLNSSYTKEMNYIILKQDGYMHGCGVTYEEGSAIMKDSDVVLGGNFKVVAGQRAPCGKLINADGDTVQLYRLFTPNNIPSRFTLLILLNSIAEYLDEFTIFAEWVEDFKSNLADKTAIPIESLLSVIVAQTETTETTLVLHDQLFHDKGGKLREKYGASDDEPAIFVIRPDGYIGAAWLLSETSGVEGYFKRILNT